YIAAGGGARRVTLSGHAFLRTSPAYFYTARGDLDWVGLGDRPDEADEAGADEEEEGEGHAQDERAVRIRTGSDEAGCRPEPHQNGSPVGAKGVGRDDPHDNETRDHQGQLEREPEGKEEV